MTRRTIASLIVFATLSLTQPSAHAQAKPGHLDEVLHQMDAASTRFKSAQADFRWDIYERVVRQTTTQNGSIYFVKGDSKTQMGAKILPPFTKLLDYKNGQLRIFDPGSDQLTLLNAGTNQAQYESFLTLGFGGSGTDLSKAWTITDLGPETLNDGSGPVETVKLDLVSKTQSIRDLFTHIIIWVDPKRGISLKQQFFTPSEDQKTATYLHIRYNQKVDTAAFTIKTDKKTTISRH